MLKAHVDIHIERKLVHLFGVLAMVVAHHYLSERACWIVLIVLGLPLVIFDILRQRFENLRVLTPKIFGPIMRRTELNNLTGTTFLLLGTALIFLLFPHDIVSLSLLFLAIADPTASYFGLKYGTHRIIGKKTFEGALAAFIVCTVIAALFFHYKGLMLPHIAITSLLAGAIGCLSELIPVGDLDDNFTQPVANSIFLYVLFYLFGGLS